MTTCCDAVPKFEGLSDLGEMVNSCPSCGRLIYRQLSTESVKVWRSMVDDNGCYLAPNTTRDGTIRIAVAGRPG